MSLHLLIPDRIITQIITIIEDKNNCKIELVTGLNSYWLIDTNGNGEYENELRLATLGDIRLIISRVAFTNKRNGTMTAVLDILKKFCLESEIKEILIQSVLSKEMMDFCMKNNFVPADYNLLVDDLLSGDYTLSLHD